MKGYVNSSIVRTYAAEAYNYLLWMTEHLNLDCRLNTSKNKSLILIIKHKIKYKK